jgi:hypothetical protein
MTSQSPRIYIYKITFEEVLYYYYGVHKEKKFDEYYMGSPKTHKWCWELYTPKKQILEIFPFTDEGWLEAQKIEKRIIAPVLNEKSCLNESCGGVISLDACSKGGKESGKIVGKKTYELGIGIFSFTQEQMIENSRKGGTIGGKITGRKTYELGIGIHGRTKDEMVESGRKLGKMYGNHNYELGIGIHGRTKEKRTEDCKKGANQKWLCLETGYVTNAGALTNYQRKRGIDTSKRKQVEE